MSSISFSGGGAENEVIVATYSWSAVDLAIDCCFFVADRSLTVVGINGRVRVVGSDAGTVTGQLRKAASTVAPASGVLLHTGTFNLKGTADTNQTLTLSTTASDLTVPSGTGLCFDLTGISTAANGCITVSMVAGG